MKENLYIIITIILLLIASIMLRINCIICNALGIILTIITIFLIFNLIKKSKER